MENLADFLLRELLENAEINLVNIKLNVNPIGVKTAVEIDNEALKLLEEKEKIDSNQLFKVIRENVEKCFNSIGEYITEKKLENLKELANENKSGC